MIDKKTRSVLIIDDEASIRNSLNDYFADQLWNTFQVESAEDALKLLNLETIDIAIVDIRLGGIDGNTFIKKAHKEYPDMKFVISTGSPETGPDSGILTLRCVSDQVFQKPVTNMEKLESELMRMIDLDN